MKDEIKEILWIIKSCKQDYDKQKDGMHTFDYGELYLLYNYITNLEDTLIDKQECIDAYNEIINNRDKKITNLQQENERLKEQVNENKVIVEYAIKPSFTTRKLKDYKSRCEKAIEYNNQIIKDTKDFYRPTTDIIYSGDCLIEIATNNINILQNGSDSQ